MKVLVVGSDSVHLLNFLHSLEGKGLDVFFLSQDEGDFGYKKDFVVNGRAMRPKLVAQNKKKIKEILLSLEPDLIHIHQANRTAFWVSSVASQLAIPILLTTWGSDVLVAPKKSPFHRYVAKRCLKWAQKITADADFMIDSMVKLDSNRSKYYKIQYGIDPITSNAKENIIYSNRLWSELYNIPQVIEYFDEFAVGHPDWKLVIAGAGDQEELLRSMVKASKHKEKISFVGWVNKEENASWYAKSMIYVSIPNSDGTSVSVLEAMSAGCIPVLSDIPVSKEWVVHGENGIIVTKEKNPFGEVLQINMNEAREINKLKIQDVERGNCTNQFIELYKEIVRK